MNPATVIALLSALIAVESPRTTAQARAAIAREGAYGCLQIRQCCLDDVSRVTGKTVTLKQCGASEGVSLWVCVQYLRYWGAHYRKQTGKEPTPEVLARIWNSGPQGWRRESTEGYWKKVKVVLEKASPSAM